MTRLRKKVYGATTPDFNTAPILIKVYGANTPDFTSNGKHRRAPVGAPSGGVALCGAVKRVDCREREVLFEKETALGTHHQHAWPR
ncbi:hypothetical protein Pmani_011732 [Petrolisthes manimaculis]|uniref:Uncharacterized protein n=1 Tax=Petrolisthes manimaculis TaxID=1843537 RepID=A0AAE1PZ34_9EUCA|nr:hypothetical protein Pmani_011732 [Petrolisthes manimaculis]